MNGEPTSGRSEEPRGNEEALARWETDGGKVLKPPPESTPRFTRATTDGPPSPERGTARAVAPAARRWSWRLGAIAGVDIYVHATFALLLAWFTITPLLRREGLGTIANGLLLILGVFACVVLHELSHALTARRFGIRTRDITLLPIGGVARLEHLPEKPSQELLVALAGPAMSLVIAAALFVMLKILNGPTLLESLQVVGAPFLTELMWINISLAAFNLLPALPMDGGRVLRAALAMQFGRGRATELAGRIAQGFALLFGIAGILWNPFLVVIAVFVWMGAKSEVSMVQLKSALKGMPVSQAMLTDFRVLTPQDSLGHAVELMLAGFQHHFPVLDGDRLAGVLTQANVLQGLAQGGADSPVETVMQRQVVTAEPSEMLEPALERLQTSGSHALIVVREDRVVGLITPESIGQMLTIDKALAWSRAHPQAAPGVA